MQILAVDDEKLELNALMRALREVFPDESISGFQKIGDVLEFLKKNSEEKTPVQYAFLDMKLRGITGIELAKLIKESFPEAKIVFCTAYSEYAFEAYKVYALGYLLKTIKAEDIRNTLRNMDKSWIESSQPEEKHTKAVKVQTFGNFEVFVDGKPMVFERAKAKELFAYLIDRRGASVTTAEIAGILFEDREYDRNLKSQTNVIMNSLKTDLKKEGIGELYLKTWNHLAIDVSRLRCDAYDFMKGDPIAVNSYNGEYMANYSWAEFSKGVFEKHGNYSGYEGL